MYINQSVFSGIEKKACGPSCVLMALWYKGSEASVEDILSDPVITEDNLFDAEGNSRHAMLVRILGNFGVLGYCQEFTHKSTDELEILGRQKVIDWVSSGNLCLASVFRGFDTKAISGHVVLVRGVSGDEFCIDDPDCELGGPGLMIPFDTFFGSWKKRVIFIE